MAEMVRTIPIKCSEEKDAVTVARGSIFELIFGLAAVVFAIIGLGGGSLELVLPIATIMLGIAIVSSSESIARKLSCLISETENSNLNELKFRIGVSAQTIGGAAGLILGIIALCGIATEVFVPIAIILCGIAMLLGIWPIIRLTSMDLAVTDPGLRLISREEISAATIIQIVSGLAAVILGILGIVGAGIPIVTIAAILALGAAVSISGVALGTKMVSVYRHV